MRISLSFLLAILLSLNTAYATAVGICDALEHTSSQAAHLGHHSHEHSDDHAHDDPPVDPNWSSKVPMLGEHHHDHAHSSFSSILPDIISVIPLTGCSPQVAIPASTFVSIPQALPYHPPRATLA
jgi:ABC-type nickel/cobalt efflux system permease component RcnA